MSFVSGDLATLSKSQAGAEIFRSPELLLGVKEYTTAVDVWSIGCIFAELMQKEPLFAGRGEIDQINKVSRPFRREQCNATDIDAN